MLLLYLDNHNSTKNLISFSLSSDHHILVFVFSYRRHTLLKGHPTQTLTRVSKRMILLFQHQGYRCHAETNQMQGIETDIDRNTAL